MQGNAYKLTKGSVQYKVMMKAAHPYTGYSELKQHLASVPKRSDEDDDPEIEQPEKLNVDNVSESGSEDEEEGSSMEPASPGAETSSPETSKRAP